MHASTHADTRFRQSAVDQFLCWTLFAMLASSFVVFIQPAPVDVIFLVVLVLFLQTRLTIVINLLPLVVFLLLYNLGGFTSYFSTSPQPKATMFVVTSAYMAVTGIVFAYLIANDPIHKFSHISHGWTVGAVLATVWGLIDYFQLPSPFTLQVLEGRATGLFKDPNVFSTFIIFPAVLLLQKLFLGTARRPFFAGITLTFIVLGLFLSFSRGAWMNFVLAVVVMFGLSFIVTADARIRTRMLLSMFAALLLAVIGFLLLMSIPPVQDMFIQRFALFQYYDAGETGRFGNQLRSIPDLITLPFGHGPLGFAAVYGMDPHNTFINAFSSYGWLGGISYFLMVLSTLMFCFGAIFIPSPWQFASISAFATLLSTILQGIQIDTEHWRHFYWLLGICWGFAAASMYNQRSLAGRAHHPKVIPVAN